jgi:hypothetical protein
MGGLDRERDRQRGINAMVGGGEVSLAGFFLLRFPKKNKNLPRGWELAELHSR